MTDYIEREALLERIDGIWDCADMVFEPNDKCCRADDCASCKWRETKNAIRKIAAYLPAADVREVKRGKWIKYAPHNSDMMTCSECEKYWILPGDQYDFKFCPNCGADMREEQT